MAGWVWDTVVLQQGLVMLAVEGHVIGNSANLGR